MTHDGHARRWWTIFLAHYRAHIADGSAGPFRAWTRRSTALKREGARLGVLTNKPQDLTDLLLPKLELDRYFAAVYGAGRMPYTKPDPRIFHDVVAEDGGGGPARDDRRLHDRPADRARRRRAVILVSYGYTPVPAAELGADMVLDDFADLPEAIGSLGLG